MGEIPNQSQAVLHLLSGESRLYVDLVASLVSFHTDNKYYVSTYTYLSSGCSKY